MSIYSGQAPEWMDADYLQLVLRTWLKDSNLQLEHHEVAAGSSFGENFAGMVLRIHLKSNLGDHVMIAKYLKSTALTNVVKGVLDLFGTELRMFKVVFPEIKKQLGEVMVPELYFADEEHKTLFMEDLCLKGYRLGNRNPALDLNHTLLAVEALAKFHGAGLQFIQKNPETKELFRMYPQSEEAGLLPSIIMSGYNVMMKALPSMSLSQQVKDTLKGLRDEFIDRTYKAALKNEDDFNSLIHGDCWMNNIMFSYTDDTPVSAKFLDFQCCNYHAVAFDLVYFVSSSSNADVQTSQLDTVFDKYYQSLVAVTGDIPGFSLELLKQQVFQRLFFGVTMTIGVLPGLMKVRGQSLTSETIQHITSILNFYERHHII